MASSDKSPEVCEVMSEIDRAIHEPARLAILLVLNEFEAADFLFLLRQTQLTRGNLSSHLGKLEQAGYIEITKEFVDRVPRTLAKLTLNGCLALKSYGTIMARILRQI